MCSTQITQKIVNWACASMFQDVLVMRFLLSLPSVPWHWNIPHHEIWSEKNCLNVASLPQMQQLHRWIGSLISITDCSANDQRRSEGIIYHANFFRSEQDWMIIMIIISDVLMMTSVSTGNDDIDLGSYSWIEKCQTFHFHKFCQPMPATFLGLFFRPK